MMDPTLFTLKNAMCDFISDVSEIFNKDSEERSDLMNVSFMCKQKHPESLLLDIKTHLLPHKDQIQKRDLDYFKSNMSIFEGLPSDRVEHYRSAIINGKRIAKDDINMVWDHLDVIIVLSEKC